MTLKMNHTYFILIILLITIFVPQLWDINYLFFHYLIILYKISYISIATRQGKVREEEGKLGIWQTAWA